MMKSIMTARVAVAALAASALTALPAIAGPTTVAHGHVDAHLGKNASVSISFGTSQIRYDRGYRHGVRYNDRYARHGNYYGQSKKTRRRLRRNAIRACRSAIRYEADLIGFRDVDFDDDRRVTQIGPNGFRIFFEEVEFEGRRREFERSVTCVARRGQVVRLRGIPEPGRYRHRKRAHHGY